MAQLNPNFEFDFDDINSYEQIQLINDTQLAKENMLMHRAYKEPSDDEIIRNQFSSFTFIDFCPKLYTSTASRLRESANQSNNSNQSSTNRPPSATSLRYNELESFSDLFDRINSWLKINEEWRVVSMQTLTYDSKSQFNHLKSSIQSNYLPQNTRGLRLFLSPSKSRFSGPQKIGCINVVPRKVSGSHTDYVENPPVYETLDEILTRLNELLLTRPIEGRIISVETLTLPVVNGFVNTEINYFNDLRVNIMNELHYTPISLPDQPKSRFLDILRVYYEFGPVVCGLVNLIDFLPRFYSPTPITSSSPTNSTNINGETTFCLLKIPATESMTRLIRRSLAWFEHERKMTMEETDSNFQPNNCSGLINCSKRAGISLKMCNMQVCSRILSRSELIQLNDKGKALSSIKTRQMLHEKIKLSQTICAHCSVTRSSSPAQVEDDWCPHMIDLSVPYEVKFVRLVYVVPVYNNYARLSSMRLTSGSRAWNWKGSKDVNDSCSSLSKEREKFKEKEKNRDHEPTKSCEATSSQKANSPPLAETSSSSSNTLSSSSSSSELPYLPVQRMSIEVDAKTRLEQADERSREINSGVNGDVDKVGEDEVKLAALEIVKRTTERHHRDELAHQLRESADGLRNTPIGQLTYRLFAPCQLVSSSSCFSINPVNSSSPLSRRGSVNLIAGTSSTTQVQQVTSNSVAVADQQQVSNPFASSFFTGATLDVPDNLQDQLISSPPSSTDDYRPTRRKSAASVVSGHSRMIPNDFELVDAIRRRMEVYVTTNSMKVIAGETIIVNLRDSLSCLSTAIEQAVVKRDFSFPPESSGSTWVSAYILYAAVEKPQVPEQLIVQQQKLNISTRLTESPINILSHLNDHLKDSKEEDANKDQEQEAFSSQSCIRIEQNPVNASLILYNSAYDRTVALPAPPENDSSFDHELFELMSSRLVDDDILTNKSPHGRKYIRRKRKTKPHYKQGESQCSIM